MQNHSNKSIEVIELSAVFYKLHKSIAKTSSTSLSTHPVHVYLEVIKSQYHFVLKCIYRFNLQGFSFSKSSQNYINAFSEVHNQERSLPRYLEG